MQKVCTPASTATAVPWLCGGRVGPCICRPASRRAFLRVLTGRVASLVCVPVRNRRLFVRIMRHMGALWLRRARAECRRARAGIAQAGVATWLRSCSWRFVSCSCISVLWWRGVEHALSILFGDDAAPFAPWSGMLQQRQRCPGMTRRGDMHERNGTLQWDTAISN